MSRTEVPIHGVQAAAYTVPTDGPESDGTLSWDKTTMVTAEISAGGVAGFGYTYCHSSAAAMIGQVLASAIQGRDAFDLEAAWQEMISRVRNIGRPGLAACAISAVDIALWDLKAKLLDVPLVTLLGAAQSDVAAYGSGGFTSYDEPRLCDQLQGWTEQGCAWVKMKVGRDPSRDAARVRAARDAIGEAGLFVDANGAYTRKESLRLAQEFSEAGVCWLEEPVSSDDLEGLRLVRDRAPAGMEIAAGEYGYTPFYFRRLLEGGAVDVLQADVTRCGGVTGFLRAAALADAFAMPLSSHCAPSVHLHPACAAARTRHMEWFHDHVRIEQMLFDGTPRLNAGRLAPDLSQPGHGLRFRTADARTYEV